MGRQPDRIRVETEKGTFDRFSSVEIKHDLSAFSEGTFELGDDGTYPSLEKIIAPGSKWRVYLNDRLQLTGRSEVVGVDMSAEASTSITLIVRTKLSDAKIRSADTNIRTEKTSIKDFILALFKPLGYAEADFNFAPGTARDLMTGASGGAAEPKDLDSIQADQAKVQPGETIFDAAARHLARHHMMIWDSPDGRICIGAPDDTQPPLYRFIAKRSAGNANNLKKARYTRDWSEVPSEIVVYGGATGKDISKASFAGISPNNEVQLTFQETGEFNRKVVILDQGAKTKELALAHSKLLMSQVRRNQNSWDFTLDGFGYWNGQATIGWSTNAVADVDVDVVGGPRGTYLIHKTRAKWSADTAMESVVTGIAKGLWEL